MSLDFGSWIDRWIPLIKSQWREKYSHLMTSSYVQNKYYTILHITQQRLNKIMNLFKHSITRSSGWAIEGIGMRICDIWYNGTTLHIVSEMFCIMVEHFYERKSSHCVEHCAIILKEEKEPLPLQCHPGIRATENHSRLVPHKRCSSGILQQIR